MGDEGGGLPNFGGKSPDCDHLWVKFLIQSAIFKSFHGEKPEIFPCGTFLFRVVNDVYVPEVLKQN